MGKKSKDRTSLARLAVKLFFWELGKPMFSVCDCLCHRVSSTDCSRGNYASAYRGHIVEYLRMYGKCLNFLSGALEYDFHSSLRSKAATKAEWFSHRRNYNSNFPCLAAIYIKSTMKQWTRFSSDGYRMLVAKPLNMLNWLRRATLCCY